MKTVFLSAFNSGLDFQQNLTAHRQGCNEIEVNEPSQEVLNQLNTKRPNYELSFKIY